MESTTVLAVPNSPVADHEVIKPVLRGGEASSLSSDTASLTSFGEESLLVAAAATALMSAATTPTVISPLSTPKLNRCFSSLTVDTLVSLSQAESQEVNDQYNDKVVETIIAPTSVVVAVETRPIAQQILDWDGVQTFSELIYAGLVEKYGPEVAAKDFAGRVHMVYESPSSASQETSFHNASKYLVYDYPPTPRQYWSVMRPTRYSAVNGSTFPSYLVDKPHPLLLEHWKTTIPNYVEPNIVTQIPQDAVVNAYMPLQEHDGNLFVNDPAFHYHLAGKDAIPEMTAHTTRLLPNTRDVRPCVAKVTHAMGSLGIFVIRNDEDEQEFQQFLEETGHPSYVVTEWITIQRNLACQFYIHPRSGNLTWFGSSENLLLENGNWSSDATFFLDQHQEMQDLLCSYAQDIARYASERGFFGFCGIDVLFDPMGNGYTVDVNPRVTGSMPALMVGQRLYQQDPVRFAVGKFRKSTKWIYPGSVEELMHFVQVFNSDETAGKIVLFAVFAKQADQTQLNVAVYGPSSDYCDNVFAKVCVATGAGRD